MKIKGQKNIEKLLLDSLENNHSKELYSVLTGKPIVYYFGNEFAEKFMQLRVKHGIYLKSLRVTEENFDTQKHKNYSGYKKEIKHVESNIFTKSMFLYDNQVIIFDMDNMKCEYIEDGEIFNKHLKKFNQLW